MTARFSTVLGLATALALSAPAASQEGATTPLQPMDIFDLEVAADPRISPDGEQVVYLRRGFDVMSDGSTTSLWMVRSDGSYHRALTDGTFSVGSPRWSPSGDRLAYVSSGDDDPDIWVRWMDTGEAFKVTDLPESPGQPVWSRDGRWIAFTMFVPEERQAFTSKMPSAPQGADWGPPIQVVEDVQYKSDGRPGIIEPGHRHVFVVPAEGGAARQVTEGAFDHGSPAWIGSEHLVVSANRRDDADYVRSDTELYEVEVATGSMRALTDRFGPDGDPVVSPDARQIAYTGHEEEYLGYQPSLLYVVNRDGSGVRRLLQDLDRGVGSVVWAPDGGGLYFSYGDEGATRVGFTTLDGDVREVASELGGMSLGRPYASGAFSVGGGDRIAFTHGQPQRPADVAVATPGGEARILTDLNGDLLAHRRLGEVEEIWYESSYDGREIQGWIVTPPDFDPSGSYPLILEIHGGPFSMYAPVYSSEVQLYAAAGYVVLYTNPRGSTGYGKDFGNLIHHAYPSQDYDDLISGVDAVLERGYVDPERLFVTGGSGGGVLSSWIVGMTDRFSAAVVQKPVINWYSWALYADMYVTGSQYWFPGPPWEHEEHYMDRSPISLVGNVTTPTMLITGEQDYRTPMPDSEQYYGALKLRKIPSALVRVPDAGHGIASRPSNLLAKVAHILEWFERYPRRGEAAVEDDISPHR